MEILVSEMTYYVSSHVEWDVKLLAHSLVISKSCH